MSTSRNILQSLHRERIFATIALLTYAMVVLVVAIHHEPWRDEADAWLAARDLRLGELFHWTRYAGTPGLWYLILMPLAKSGLPYLSLTLVHLAIAVGMTAIILCAAPFSRPMRCLIAGSFHFAYEYAVIARNYSLMALLLFLIAALFPRRSRTPLWLGALLALLFNTTVHGFFIASTIWAVLAWDAFRHSRLDRRTIVGLGIAALGALLAIVQLLPPPGGQLQNGLVLADPSTPSNLLCRPFFPSVPPNAEGIRKIGIPSRLAPVALVCMHIAGAAILLSTTLSLLRHPYALFITLASFASLSYVFLFKWFGGDRHGGIILLVILFALWIAQTDETPGQSTPSFADRLHRFAAPIARLGLALSLIFSCAMTAVYFAMDWRHAFSGAREAGLFLRSQDGHSLPIAAHSDPAGGAVLPYLASDTRFWYIGRQDYGTHMLWNAQQLQNVHLPEDELLRRTRRAFASQPHLLLLDRALRNPDSNGYELIFANRRRIFRRTDESYYVYRHLPQPLPATTPASPTGP